MNVLDLFSGIGGFSLGLERSGMRTVAFCEIEPFCRSVLKKHWPDVPIFEDVTKLKASDINEQVNVIAGGFPCQDISTAGRGAGLSGSRSGLWFEYHRLINEIQPQFAIIENVSALRSRGLDDVLRSLVEIGYDAEWHCIPASAVGAPHRRDRIWIVAYPSRNRLQEREGKDRESFRSERLQSGMDLIGKSFNVADAIRIGQQGPWTHGDARNSETNGEGQTTQFIYGGFGNIWRVEPDVGRVANGVPGRVDRLRALGNAVVPQIPEMIGRAIMDAMK
jgi:DNA (cytosine-5)-methyltransferase 1